MIVYRITHKKFSDKLMASGIENRWNTSGQLVIYCSSNKALACLENLVAKPAFGVDNQVPNKLLLTSTGIKLIMDELSRIQYGDFAW